MNLAPLSGLLSPLSDSEAATARTFSPDDIVGLQLWLNASAITGLADGDPVALWPDSSTPTNHASQATAASRPLYHSSVFNGLPAVRFDGIDDALILAAPVGSGVSDWTVFAVYQPTDTSNGRGLLAAHNNDGTLATSLYIQTARSANPGSYGYYDGSGHEFDLQQMGPQIVVWRLDAAGATFRRNGVPLGGTLPYTRRALGVTLEHAAIGGDATVGVLKGDIAELLVYDSALITADISAVESYQMTKYGL